MDISAVCRTCLGDEHLNPIFPKFKECQRYSNAVYITTGMKVGPDDGFPQQICSHCIHFINQSLKFRKTCKDVQIKLLENIQTVLKNNIQEAQHEDLLVFSGNNSHNNDTNIKIEAEISESNEHEVKYTDYETRNIKIEAEISESNEHEVKYTDYETRNIKIEAEISESIEHEVKYTDYETRNIKIEAEISESNEDEVKYTDYEAIIDHEENLPLSHPSEEEIHNIIAEKDSTSVKLSIPDLYTIDNTSKTQVNRVVCKLCQKNLSVRSIDAHMDKAHPGADERKIKCELCDSYVTKQKMSRRLKLKHGIQKGQDRKCRCGYCKTEFSKEELIKHVASCTAKKKKRKVYKSSKQLVECDVCSKQMLKGSLKLHKAMSHGGMKLVCEHCGQNFGTKFRLNEHYRAKHGYDKFKCSYSNCDFMTASTVSMQNHTRKHLKEKPFICETCGAKFHAPYLLSQHKQSHRTERAYTCSTCSASFKSVAGLHIHKKACHSPAVYKCTMCSKAFSSRIYAVKHMRRTHRFYGSVPELPKVVIDENVHGEV